LAKEALGQRCSARRGSAFAIFRGWVEDARTTVETMGPLIARPSRAFAGTTAFWKERPGLLRALAATALGRCSGRCSVVIVGNMGAELAGLLIRHARTVPFAGCSQQRLEPGPASARHGRGMHAQLRARWQCCPYGGLRGGSSSSGEGFKSAEAGSTKPKTPSTGCGRSSRHSLPDQA